VKSVYVGRGEIAQMVAQIQSDTPLLERLARANKSSRVINEEKAQAQLVELSDHVRLLTEGCLLAAGFHTHKRQWRKMRNGRAIKRKYA